MEKKFSELISPTKAPCDLPKLHNVQKNPYQIDLQPPSFVDVLWALKNMKSNKDSEEDGISAEMYKSSPTLLCQLKDLLVEIWTKK